MIVNYTNDVFEAKTLTKTEREYLGICNFVFPKHSRILKNKSGQLEVYQPEGLSGFLGVGGYDQDLLAQSIDFFIAHEDEFTQEDED